MKAFVLSGGGNYGALQVGALDVLLERDIQPDMLVGVSVGALNAAFLAADPTRAGMQRLVQAWCDSAPAFFSPPNRLNMLLRLAQGRDSLLPNESLQHFIRIWAPAAATFGDFAWPHLYVVATRLPDGAMRVFGDDPADSLFDGLMASTALPPLFPPWEVEGQAYVDGGVVSDLPLQVAAARGANEIFALQIARRPLNSRRDSSPGILAVSGQSLAALIDRNAEYEMQAIRNRRDIRLHLIRLWPQIEPGFWDFSHARELIADGRRCAEHYLMEAPQPVPWHGRGQRWLGRLRGSQHSDFVPMQTSEQEV